MKPRLALLLLGPLALSLLAPLPLPAQDDAALARARKLLKKYPLIDGHNDLPWKIREKTGAPGDVDGYDLRKRTEGDTDFERLREGGVGGQFWSVYIPAEDKGGFVRTQLEQIDIARRVIARYPDRFTLTGTADEVERAMRRGRIVHLARMVRSICESVFDETPIFSMRLIEDSGESITGAFATAGR